MAESLAAKKLAKEYAKSVEKHRKDAEAAEAARAANGCTQQPQQPQQPQAAMAACHACWTLAGPRRGSGPRNTGPGRSDVIWSATATTSHALPPQPRNAADTPGATSGQVFQGQVFQG